MLAALEAMTGEWIDGRAQHADSGADQNHRYPGHRIVAGGNDDRNQNAVKRKGFLGHAVSRAAKREQRHQDRNHPDLSAFQMSHDAAYTGVDRTGGIYHTEKAAQKQHEQRHVDGLGDIAFWIIKARNGSQHDVHKALGAGLNHLVSTWHSHFTADLFVHDPFILSGGNDPGKRSNQNDQQKQDGVGRWKAASQILFRVLRGSVFFSHGGSPSLWPH